MDTFFGIVDALRILLQLRYMFVGVIVGWILGVIFRKLVDGIVGNDGLIVIVVICAVIGIVLDIRRGLRG